MNSTLDIEHTSSMLSKLGVNDDEARVYSLVVSLGSCTVGEISRMIDLSRAKIYKVFDKLMSRGWVKIVSDSPRTFVPMDPRKILSQTKSDMDLALESALDELVPTYDRTISRSADISFYHGSDTFRTIAHMLKGAKNDVSIMTMFIPSDALTGLWDTLAELKRKGVKTKMIISNDLRNTDIVGKLKEVSEVRTRAKIPDAGLIIIDGKYVLIGSNHGTYPSLDELTGILTDDEQMAKFFTVVFQQFYARGKSVTNG